MDSREVRRAVIRAVLCLLSTVHFLVISLCFFSGKAFGLASGEDGDFRLKFTGYFKNILAYSDPSDFPLSLMLGMPPNPFFDPGVIHDPAHWDDLSRLRLRLEGRYGKEWAGEIQAELRNIARRPDLNTGGFLTSSPAAQRWLNMEATIYDESGNTATGFVDRMWVRWAPGWGEFVLGRQAITWTVGRMWFPMDRFGPFLPFSIEQDEKSGVDAANFAINLGAMAEFRVIFAPLIRPEDDRIGARLRANIYGFDFQLMGGYFSEEYVGGLGAAHNFYGAVVRAEYAYSHTLNNDPDRWSAIAGFDRTFSKKLYTLLEYYHQSAGQIDPDLYYKSFPLYASGALYGIGRDYIGVTLKITPQPEWSFATAGIVNLNDSSSFIGPQIEYNYGQNLKITLAASLSIPSSDNSEFGLFSNVYYLSFKGYF